MVVKTSCLDVSIWMGGGTGSHQGLPHVPRNGGTRMTPGVPSLENVSLQLLMLPAKGWRGFLCPLLPWPPTPPVTLTEVSCPRLLSSPSSARSSS